MHDVSGKESRARELSCVCVRARVIMGVYSASQFHLPKLDSEAVMEDFFWENKKVTCKSLCRDIIMYPRYERCERKQSTDMHVNHFQQDPMLCVLDHNWAVIVQSELGKH